MYLLHRHRFITYFVLMFLFVHLSIICLKRSSSDHFYKGNKHFLNTSCILPCNGVCAEEVAGLQCMKRILGKVQEMRDQRGSLEKQLRDLIQQDDITSTLVTTERADMKVCGLSATESEFFLYSFINLHYPLNVAPP